MKRYTQALILLASSIVASCATAGNPVYANELISGGLSTHVNHPRQP